MLAQPGAKQFTFVLDEAALRHRFGSAATMRAQLLQVERLSHLPSVAVQVLSFAGSYPIGPGGFALLEFAPVHGTRVDDVVYIEHLTGTALLKMRPKLMNTDGHSSDSQPRRWTRRRPDT